MTDTCSHSLLSQALQEQLLPFPGAEEASAVSGNLQHQLFNNLFSGIPSHCVYRPVFSLLLCSQSLFSYSSTHYTEVLISPLNACEPEDTSSCHLNLLQTTWNTFVTDQLESSLFFWQERPVCTLNAPRAKCSEFTNWKSDNALNLRSHSRLNLWRHHMSWMFCTLIMFCTLSVYDGNNFIVFLIQCNG